MDKTITINCCKHLIIRNKDAIPCFPCWALKPSLPLIMIFFNIKGVFFLLCDANFILS